MGDKDDRLLQHPLDAQEFVLHLAADQGVQSTERFIQKPKLRLHCQGACNAHPLLLATRQLARIGILAPAKADQINHPGRTFALIRWRKPLQPQGKGDVLDHVQMRQKAKVLKHHAHLVTADVDQLTVGLGQKVLAVQKHLTVVSIDQPRQAAHDGRFSRP